MAKLFPFRSERTRSSGEPRLVDIDDDASAEVFAALSSDTARAILSRLYEGPETASAVAESADTSIQNARYHLEKLESAGLIEAVDTWYSSRGTEMTVYAPTNEPLVVAAGTEESKGVLRRALERVVSAVAALALASVVIDRLARRSRGLFGDIGGRTGAEPGDASTPAATDAPTGGAGTATDAHQATNTQAPALETSTDVGVATNTPSPSPRSIEDGTTQPSPSVPAEKTPTEPLDAAPSVTDPPATTSTGGPTPTDPSTPIDTLADATPTTVGSVADVAPSVPPGALFFAGGLAVIAAGAAWWYWSEYRPMYAT